MPSTSPSVLNTAHDYKQKSNFLHSLGLKFVPPHIRRGKSSSNVFLSIFCISFNSLDTENVWMEIIEERLKRDCESALTKYSLLYHKKVASKMEKSNGLLERGTKVKSESSYGLAQKRFPIFQPMKRENDGYLNGTVQYAYTPITMVLIEQRKGENINNVGDKSYAVMEKRINDVVPLVKQEKQKIERVKADDEGLKWPGLNEVMEAYHKYDRG